MQDFVQDLSGGGNFNFHGLILLLSPKILVYLFIYGHKTLFQAVATLKTFRNHL